MGAYKKQLPAVGSSHLTFRSSSEPLTPRVCGAGQGTQADGTSWPSPGQVFGWQGGEKCWHLAIQQQLPLHLELLLQQLLLCCLLVAELKHLVIGIVLSSFLNTNENLTVINIMAK